ncbi:PssD/Cps14F family polysaccharide biosynthesis glycosyltransferase [Salegentibacter salegens]|uniref:Oligosaccharide biosynthesis protein Alg14 like n=1 Tax=Salegentibacter salegens TaxID=143223 RepID=A0A1M7NJH3_9FLAO|nr:PssD/Cps14F family polysaccharide biosynthesis glycosyltransferase [Salegentibacter salegens]PRX39835.1 oligosaccharide biosynthesis protein Alg14 [Salegentibacter salegens]SHN04000.1 Oligosaccharide biosynthesis protein Alg14 like [Salegentibacter salegens]
MENKKIILLSSDGGHLAQILELNEMFLKYNYLIVTEESPATLPLREKYNIKFLKARAKGKKRNLAFIFVLFFNAFISLKILIQHFPKAIITTGSSTTVPMCLLGKLGGTKIIYILSYARVNSRAFSADILYPIADKFIIQWPGVKKFYKKAVYLGGIY